MLELKVIKSPELSGGEGPRFEVAEGRSTLVGRAEECQIRLPSSGISKKHCVITPISATRIEVEDLGSSNGTYINGLLIKKHIMQPGDTLGLHNFVLQLGKKVPEVVDEDLADDAFNTDFSGDAIDASSTKKQEDLGSKILNWIEEAVYPGADKLSQKMDVRLLCVIALGLWTLIVTTLSLNPFRELANTRVRDESTEVARLYARQLVRLNQRAVIEQRYKDLVGELDSFKGQTKGILSALIVDVQTGQILAPPEQLGQGLPNTVRYRGAKIALGRDSEYVNYDEEAKKAWVASPIKIGTAEGNKVVATALVEYSYLDGQFTIGNLIDQIVNSLLYALVLSLVFLIYVYRWIDGSVSRTAKATETALRDGNAALDLKIDWPSLRNLHQEIGFALSKAIEGGDGESMGAGGSSQWAIGAASNTSAAAAAFDENLQITFWNEKMEKISGVQANIAMGADISEASRDVAFESAVRELSADAQLMAWSAQNRSIEFSGRDYQISMVYGDSAFLLNIDEMEEA